MGSGNKKQKEETLAMDTGKAQPCSHCGGTGVIDLGDFQEIECPYCATIEIPVPPEYDPEA